MAHLISIEGTDCSGKGTQSQILADKINDLNGKAIVVSFPDYDSPTGKIIGGCYLGKEHIGKPLFPEGASNVDAKVASLFFTADRLYNVKKITDRLNDGCNVVLNRYVESNMGHQASKLQLASERKEFCDLFEKIEYDLLKLPRPEFTIFLYMPFEESCKLKSQRSEKADQHEQNAEYLKNSERAYLELAKRYNYCKIDCVENGRILSREEVGEKIWNAVKQKFPDIIN